MVKIMAKTPIIETHRTRLEIIDPRDASLMVRYYLENRDHLSPWEPDRAEMFYTIPYWIHLLSQNCKAYKNGTAIKFSALDKEKTEVIGTCNFSNIVRGAFQACHLGYSVSEKYQGQGYMFEILQAGIGYVFSQVGLHRIMANYIPGNVRSGALLSRLGFEREGLARSYLKIGGKWQDHVLTSKINPAHIEA